MEESATLAAVTSAVATGTVIALTQEVVNDPALFQPLLLKVQQGTCCIPSCSAQADLLTYLDAPPIFCLYHQDHGELTHCGSYVPTSKAYYDKWTCCNNIYRKAHCSYLINKFAVHRNTISVTDKMKKSKEERLEVLQWQAAENARQEALMNSGREECYDR